jgi:hypothetical protein
MLVSVEVRDVQNRPQAVRLMDIHRPIIFAFRAPSLMHGMDPLVEQVLRDHFAGLAKHVLVEALLVAITVFAIGLSAEQNNPLAVCTLGHGRARSTRSQMRVDHFCLRP